MRPLDPALIRTSTAIRRAVAVTVVTGITAAAASVVQAGAVAAVISDVFLDRQQLSAVRMQLIIFGIAWALRSAAVTAQDVWAREYGLQAVAELRSQAAVAFALSPKLHAGALALLTRGIDALEIYVAKYLSQLILAVLVPLGLLGYIVQHDVWTAIIIVITIPLIPIFMALIGWFTEDAVTRQWQAVGRITDVINDLFTGLPDLLIFNRARAQAHVIRKLGMDAAQTTMRVLRISFLSALALELLATISVAVVAVGIGLRLTNGELDLRTGLAVLILAPDVYLPIRMVGAQFHAAVEGMEAWSQVRPMLAASSRSSEPMHSPIKLLTVNDLVVGHDQPLCLPATFTASPGTLTAIVGPSGVGKTTLLRTIAGLQLPKSGSIRANDSDTFSIADEDWVQRVSYLTQDPWLGHGDVRAALTKGSVASDSECTRALAAVGLEHLYLNARIDDLGSGISVGQRRRIALARLLLRNPDVLLLDEPTAAVDPGSEAAVLGALRDFCARGRIVIAVAHRPALVESADQVVRVMPL